MPTPNESNRSETANPHPINSIVTALLKYKWVWLIPTLLFAFLSAGYAYLGPKQFQASQKLHVRDELIGQKYRPGRFESLDVMKTAQETIQEIARSPSVLRRTFQMAEGNSDPNWPSDETIEDSQGAVVVSAPNGAELGKTEVILLSIKSSSQQKARKLLTALCDETERELRQVRQKRAESMRAELQHAVDQARTAYDQSAKALSEFEAKVGADLTDLRTLNDPTGGEGGLRRSLGEIRSELRKSETLRDLFQKQRQHLDAARKNAVQLVAIPNELLELLPTLAQLKTGLTAAQLQKAQLVGQLRPEHPKVLNAENSIREIVDKIYAELNLAISGLDSRREVNKAKMDRLKNQQADILSRLNRLSELRVPYRRLLEEFHERETTLQSAESKLAQTQSILSAAENVNLITRIDEPQVSARPLGPSKKFLVGSSSFVGLMLGLGLVMFLSAPGPVPLSRSMQPEPNSGRSTPHPAEPSPPSQPTDDAAAEQLLRRGSFAVTIEPTNFRVSQAEVGR